MIDKFVVKTVNRTLLADTTTPVSIYYRLRDVFPNSLLLESADYHARDDSMSYLCASPLAGMTLQGETLTQEFPDGSRTTEEVGRALAQKMTQFCARFQEETSNAKGISGGLFGYMTYDCAAFFEDIKLDARLESGRMVPSLMYHFYRYIVAINHFKDELTVYMHTFPGQERDAAPLTLDAFCDLIQNRTYSTYRFSAAQEEKSNFTDEEFLSQIASVKKHVHRGDVFQMQLSRRFWRTFHGDDLNLYRALRSINPSPYLFYFDYGSFKIIGSSPEAQILINRKKASIHPIAGTFKRTGDDHQDNLTAKLLIEDPKENAEHVMLVDLARNDLSRHCTQVRVETLKEVQFYSHVIHLVSVVSGNLKEGSTTMDIVSDTFPAGTLSGAPKYRAMQLIDQYERGARGIYGGAVGHMGFNGDFNHAILIRSFLCKQNRLYYQAAGGIVAGSVDESELNEVNNKLLALKRAITLAGDL